jgi:glycosyltransferase involved in cell wall biosynthesis
MRLLFVHQNRGAYAGAEANILITARELRKAGHELALIYAEETGKGEEAWAEAFPQSFQLPPTASSRAVRQAVSEFKPDVIYIHSLNDVEGLEAATAARVPTARMVHDHSLYCLRSYKYNPVTRKTCTRPASLYCLFPCMAALKRNRGGGLPVTWASYSDLQKQLALTRLCDRLIVYSGYSRQELVRNGCEPGRIHVHVPIECWGSGGPSRPLDESNRILFAGQIIRGKGVDVLLRALAKVRAPFQCTIAGDGNHRAYCEKLAAKMGLGGRVRFAGYLPPEELKGLYQQASMLVVSSVWPEPFGMVGPEAMRYGIPVVAFDSGGISEWLIDGENGILVPWMNTNAFARAVETLLEDKPLAHEMGRRGMEHVNRVYDARTQVSRLEIIFEELIAAAGRDSKAPATEPMLETFNAEPIEETING